MRHVTLRSFLMAVALLAANAVHAQTTTNVPPPDAPAGTANVGTGASEQADRAMQPEGATSTAENNGTTGSSGSAGGAGQQGDDQLKKKGASSYGTATNDGASGQTRDQGAGQSSR